MPPPEGLRRPGVFQPELWERLDTEDIKYAAKQATRTWWDDWRGALRRFGVVGTDRVKNVRERLLELTLALVYSLLFPHPPLAQ